MSEQQESAKKKNFKIKFQVILAFYQTMKGIFKEYVFVMLMPSHSHGVTFGYIEFHLPISLQLSSANEVFLQGQTVLN